MLSVYPEERDDSFNQSLMHTIILKLRSDKQVQLQQLLLLFKFNMRLQLFHLLSLLEVARCLLLNLQHPISILFPLDLIGHIQLREYMLDLIITLYRIINNDNFGKKMLTNSDLHLKWLKI